MNRRLLVGGLLLAVALGLGLGGPLGTVTTPDAEAGTVTVTVADEDGSELGRISGRVADTRAERITGLSETASLAEEEGLIFVYPRTAERTFVMRNMSFPLDMLFVAGNGTITTIHHAAADADGGFSGDARWVIEVNRGWAAEHGVSVGDRVEGLPR